MIRMEVCERKNVKVIQEFKIIDEAFDQFGKNYKEIISDLKSVGYRCFLTLNMSSLYVEGKLEKIKEEVYQILSKYNVKVQPGICILEI
jgi:GTPase SAR1 family protein